MREFRTVDWPHLRSKGGGVKNPENSADVHNGWPLRKTCSKLKLRQPSNVSVKNSSLVFYINDEHITVPVQVDDGKEHTAYVEKLGQTIR